MPILRVFSRASRSVVDRLVAVVCLTGSLWMPIVPVLQWAGVLIALAPRFVDAQQTIDIDTADATELAARLPGIGPVKARRIVEHRERHGDFDSLEGLLAVKGIGPATLARIRAYLEGGGSDATGAALRFAEPDSVANAGSPPPVPLSSGEAERATRVAVQRLVAAAVRDAERARQRRSGVDGGQVSVAVEGAQGMHRHAERVDPVAAAELGQVDHEGAADDLGPVSSK